MSQFFYPNEQGFDRRTVDQSLIYQFDPTVSVPIDMSITHTQVPGSPMELQRQLQELMEIIRNGGVGGNTIPVEASYPQQKQLVNQVDPWDDEVVGDNDGDEQISLEKEMKKSDSKENTNSGGSGNGYSGLSQKEM